MASSSLLSRFSSPVSLVGDGRRVLYCTPYHHHRPQTTAPTSSPLRRWPIGVCHVPVAMSFACASSANAGVANQEVSLSSEKVSAVLFDMDGVLCDSEERSRLAGVDIFSEMGVQVAQADFFPFMGTGEANFLEGVAKVHGVKDFDVSSAKSRFFQIYLEKYAKPNSGLGFPGALDLIRQCKDAGLKIALASSADRLKIDANLAAAGLPFSMFDAIVSADAFKNLKPAPDIFLAAAKALDVSTNECVVIEDALAGVQAANAAGMRCIAVTTTLSRDKLAQESPSLLRKDIGDIRLEDILHLQGPGEF